MQFSENGEYSKGWYVEVEIEIGNENGMYEYGNSHYVM